MAFACEGACDGSVRRDLGHSNYQECNMLNMIAYDDISVVQVADIS